MTVFFNTEIKSGSLLENLGNFCLSPVRVLFQGKTYYRMDKVYLSERSHETPALFLRIIKIALAILFFVPGIILGTFFKGLSYLHSSVRQATENFLQAKVKKEFERVLIQGTGSSILLHGDPKDFDPSVLAFQNGYPYIWIEAHISSPRRIDLRDLKPHVAERFFTMRQDFKSLLELDISNTQLVDAQILGILSKCPALRTLKTEGISISKETYDKIQHISQTLDKRTKESLTKSVNAWK